MGGSGGWGGGRGWMMCNKEREELEKRRWDAETAVTKKKKERKTRLYLSHCVEASKLITPISVFGEEIQLRS